MINHNTDCSILKIQVYAEFTDGATYRFTCDVLCVENLKPQAQLDEHVHFKHDFKGHLSQRCFSLNIDYSISPFWFFFQSLNPKPCHIVFVLICTLEFLLCAEKACYPTLCIQLYTNSLQGNDTC